MIQWVQREKWWICCSEVHVCNNMIPLCWGMTRTPFTTVALVSCHHKVNFPEDTKTNCNTIQMALELEKCLAVISKKSVNTRPSLFVAHSTTSPWNGGKCFGIFVNVSVVSQQLVVVIFLFSSGVNVLAIQTDPPLQDSCWLEPHKLSLSRSYSSFTAAIIIIFTKGKSKKLITELLI